MANIRQRHFGGAQISTAEQRAAAHCMNDVLRCGVTSEEITLRYGVMKEGFGPDPFDLNKVMVAQNQMDVFHGIRPVMLYPDFWQYFAEV